MAVDYGRINNTLGKMALHLSTHNSICVSVSGGSDSNIIVHIIATYFREHLHKIHFMFCNTGLEYQATLRHLDYMEKRYNIHIDRIRGESVVTVVRREGIPILSKEFSKDVCYANKGSSWAIEKINRTEKGNHTYVMPPKQRQLAKYLVENEIKVSSMCCNLSKKNPNHKYMRTIKADLAVTGERKAEGGQRAVVHKNCFEPHEKVDKYMPLFFWDDETKQYYKEHEGIVYSDCYEVWGMKRTGCVGCPFNSYVGKDLKNIQKYEPNLYKACMNVFGESYRLMDKFDVHRHKILEEDNPQLEGQISLFE